MKKLLFILFTLFSACLSAQETSWVKQHYSKTEVYIPMRDGTRLFTAIYRPRDSGRNYPVLLNRTCYSVRPYGTDNYKSRLGPGERLARDGYIFVYQDVRGRYMSEGTFDNMRPQLSDAEKSDPDAFDESTDTYDTIDWLVKNVPGNNGRVGMWGISYPGFYTAVGALCDHPALKASSPQAPIADFFFDDFHHHGAFMLSYFFAVPVFGFQKDSATTESWYTIHRPATSDAYDFFLDMGSLARGAEYQGEGNVFWQQLTVHPDYDQFWQRRSLTPHLKGVSHAVMTVGGWFDAEDLYGPLTIYDKLEHDGTENYNTLVMGPWSHGDWARTGGEQKIGDISFGDSISEFYRQKIEYRFFTHFLKEGGSGETGLPEAYVFDTGKKEWKAFAQWPPRPAVKRTLYFHENGRLNRQAPAAGEVCSEFISDPANPVPYSQAREIVFTPRSYMTSDQRENASRPDVLVFETDTLAEDLTLAGNILARLQVSTTGTDADWIVKLVDVFPGDPAGREENLSNYHMLVRSEMMRGRFRNSYEKPEPFVPGKITEVNVPLQDVFHTFKKGHRIQIQVQSTWFPLIDRNPQKFVPNIFRARDSDFVKATHRVYHDAEHATAVEIMVLDNNTNQ